MSPTIETSQARSFHLLRKDGFEITIQADTICDETGFGNSFGFKRGGEIVGQAKGEFLAWWVDSSEIATKIYRFEIQPDRIIEIRANTFNPANKDNPKHILKVGENIVCTIFTKFATWWVEPA